MMKNKNCLIKKILQLLSFLCLTFYASQALSNLVFSVTPPNPSPAGIPLTFSWIDDCFLVDIDYGDANTDNNLTVNSITHTYTSAGTYFVEINGTDCSIGNQDFITVFITGGGGPGPSPGPSTPTQVNIESLQLSFDNGLAKTMVPRNQQGLQAHARLRYSGSGLLQAYWEVDGRIIERIDRHLLGGSTLELSTPEYIPLPTFISGPHSVRLVVTSPAVTPASIPKAVYFVNEQEGAPQQVELIAPQNNAVAASTESLQFRWSNSAPAARYLLEIFDDASQESVFSAYASQSQYTLKKTMLKTFLHENSRYTWRVSVLDKAGRKVSSSEKNILSVNKTSWVVEQQFMLVVEDSLLGHSIKQKLINQYQLDVIEEFPLRSLTQAVVVFRTQRESNQLLNELLREQGVVSAQTDFIYRSMVQHNESLNRSMTKEPLQDLQQLSRIIDFEVLHQKVTGQGSTIAIIDSGVEVNHPDLADAQIITSNHIKDDAYKAEIHGTAVAGIVLSQRNAIGIIGLAPQARVLALRACRQLQANVADAECFSSSLAKALDTAIVENAQLVNFSFGTPGSDPLMASLLDQASEQNILLIASAGNDPLQQALSFPAIHESVISVAGKDEGRVFPSQFLAEKADILAPSEQVFTTITGGRHNFLNGTSMSSAIASGIVSLALQNLTSTEIRPMLESRDFCAWVNSVLKSNTCNNPSKP